MELKFTHIRTFFKQHARTPFLSFCFFFLTCFQLPLAHTLTHTLIIHALCSKVTSAQHSTLFHTPNSISCPSFSMENLCPYITWSSGSLHPLQLFLLTLTYLSSLSISHATGQSVPVWCEDCCPRCRLLSAQCQPERRHSLHQPDWCCSNSVQIRFQRSFSELQDEWL